MPHVECLKRGRAEPSQATFSPAKLSILSRRFRWRREEERCLQGLQLTSALLEFFSDSGSCRRSSAPSVDAEPFLCILQSESQEPMS